jgi:hypothetical protein
MSVGPLPSDPVAPSTSAEVLYVAQTHHTLAEPFVSYRRKNGGLPIFGYPQTEAFQDGDHRVQYTDRALLEVIHGQVQVVPLGRLLTARRHFPRWTRGFDPRTPVFPYHRPHPVGPIPRLLTESPQRNRVGNTDQRGAGGGEWGWNAPSLPPSVV